MPDMIEQAAGVFLGHREVDDGTPEVQEAMLRGMGEVWSAVGAHADSPEIRVLREQALTRARRASVNRWRMPLDERGRVWRRAAAVAGVAILAGVVWQFSPHGLRPGAYQTDIGEQRMVELADQSRLILDASTRLRVDFSDDARTIDFSAGQAQFSVAQDRGRPFKVRVGGYTFVALGTTFTVDYAGGTVTLAMLEGRVALIDGGIEVGAGQGIRIPEDGKPRFLARADLEAAMAWRQGKVVFHDEPLGQAVHRLNRYSRLQLQIQDEQLATLKVSGVFDAGDIRGFLEVVQAYLPIKTDQARQDLIRLRE